MPDYTLTVCFETSEEAQPYFLASILQEIAANASHGQWSGVSGRRVSGYSYAWEIEQEREWPAVAEDPEEAAR